MARDLAHKRGGEDVERNCEGGGGRLEVCVWTKKVMDGLERWPKFVFDSDLFGGKRLACGPHISEISYLN